MSLENTSISILSRNPPFRKTIRTPGKTSVFWQERWFNRMDKESTPRCFLWQIRNLLSFFWANHGQSEVRKTPHVSFPIAPACRKMGSPGAVSGSGTLAAARGPTSRAAHARRGPIRMIRSQWQARRRRKCRPYCGWTKSCSTQAEMMIPL